MSGEMDKGSKGQLDQLQTSISAPPKKKITKIEIGEDVSGKVARIKYYSGTEMVFMLTFSNAGSVVKTWNIQRFGQEI